jgi:hypothetical protein
VRKLEDYSESVASAVYAFKEIDSCLCISTQCLSD